MAFLTTDTELLLVLDVSSTWEDSDTADVCVISLTPEALQLFRDLHQKFLDVSSSIEDVESITWWYWGAEWFVSDYEAAVLDAYGIFPPANLDDPARVVGTTVSASKAGLRFEGYGKHTDEVLTAWLYNRDLVEIDQKLRERHAEQGDGDRASGA
jgi:hypothetical protein